MDFVFHFFLIVGIIIGVIASIVRDDRIPVKKTSNKKCEKLDTVDNFVLWGEVNNDRFFDIM